MTPEEYYAMHQKAFRTAFDFLNKHFPPGTDPSWWYTAAADVTEASMNAGDSKLAVELLTGVYNYLDYEYKKRRDSHEETDH